MNRDDLIRMALKCGATIKSDCEGNGAFGSGIDLLQFAALVAAAEREECAKLIEERLETPNMLGWNAGVMACLKAIRARGLK